MASKQEQMQMTVTFYTEIADDAASVAGEFADCDANTCLYCTSPETD